MGAATSGALYPQVGSDFFELTSFLAMTDLCERAASEDGDESMGDASFSSIWLEKLKSKLADYPSGPAALLAAGLTTDAELIDFIQWLWTEFPERADVCYHHSKELQGVSEEMLAQTPPNAFHLAAFAFNDRCSMKPPPGRDAALTLAEHILKHGFVTSGDPILAQHETLDQPVGAAVRPPWSKPVQGECLEPFSVAFIKGRARISSLLALLWVMFDGGVTRIAESHKLLWETCCVIWTQHLQQHTKEEEVLTNLKLSLKGSLRKACNVIQIAQMVRKLLKEGGTDYGSFIRKWNTQTVQSQQIKGRKAISLKLLFESAPQDC